MSDVHIMSEEEYIKWEMQLCKVLIDSFWEYINQEMKKFDFPENKQN